MNPSGCMMGKPELVGLPSSFCGKKQADTLEITLMDTSSKVKAVLFYTVFRDMDMITRSVRLINEGEKPVYIKKAASSCVEFTDSRYELVSLPGCWAMERTPQRKELFQGRQVYESRRGASSHQMNPFLALVRPETNEVHGQAYGFSFVYSVILWGRLKFLNMVRPGFYWGSIHRILPGNWRTKKHFRHRRWL